MPELTPQQCKDWRDELVWTVDQLAKAAKIAPAAINKFEAGTGKLTDGAKLALLTAFQSAGLEFTGPLPQPSTPAAGSFTPKSCKDARELLNWSHEDLGRRCGVAAGAIAAFEDKKGKLTSGAQAAVAAALERAGLKLPDPPSPPPPSSLLVVALAVAFWMALAMAIISVYR
jgi:transcriptional regulator with XRE-family HTH domain